MIYEEALEVIADPGDNSLSGVRTESHHKGLKDSRSCEQRENNQTISPRENSTERKDQGQRRIFNCFVFKVGET